MENFYWGKTKVGEKLPYCTLNDSISEILYLIDILSRNKWANIVF